MNMRKSFKEDLTFSEFMTALFPGGSITGTPKKRAMEIIKEVEKQPRGKHLSGLKYLKRVLLLVKSLKTLLLLRSRT